MKKILLSALAFIVFAGTASSQVGINTEKPMTSFDVSGKTDTRGDQVATDVAGLQAPRITRLELTKKGNFIYGEDQKGALIYITDVSGGDTSSQRANINSTGYYYFNGEEWIKFGSGSSSVITADNGLTKTEENIQLGGYLKKKTDVNTENQNFTLSGNGKIGIGTTTPSQKLDINGKLKIDDTSVVGSTSDFSALFIDKNGVVGRFGDVVKPPVAIYHTTLDLRNGYYSYNLSTYTDFNSGNNSVVPISAQYQRTNNIGVEVPSEGTLKITDPAIYQLSASLSLKLTLAKHYQYAHLSFGFQVSRDNGNTWETVAGDKAYCIGFSSLPRYYFLSTPAFIASLNKNDLIRLVVSRSKSVSGVVEGVYINQAALEYSFGAPAYSLSITKLSPQNWSDAEIKYF